MNSNQTDPVSQINQLKQKITALVTKWQGRPEAKKGSVEYMQRHLDRIAYRILRDKLRQLEMVGQVFFSDQQPAK